MTKLKIDLKCSNVDLAIQNELKDSIVPVN